MPIFTTTITGSSYTSSISNAVGFVGTASSAISASYILPNGLPAGTISSSTQQVVSTYTNATDNRVLTSTGAGGINAESTLTYDGTLLAISTNNAKYFRGGDDAAFWDINIANTVGVYGEQDSTVGAIKLGSSGPTLYGSSSGFFGIGTTTPGALLHVQGNMSASNITASNNITAGNNLISNNSTGDEGGEINLARPQTNSSISGSVVIDVYQNKVRIFEKDSPNRGGYWDVTTLGSGVGTNLAGGAGTVTQVNTGDGLSGGPITGTGTITLNTSSAHFITGSITVLNTRGVFSSSGQVNGASITNNSVSYTAGNGLTGGGSATLGGSSVTINVGAGAGVTVNADDIAINTGSTHFISGARATISVTDTVGASGIDLTYNSGTGVLSGTLVTSTFNVGAGSGLTGGGSANLGATSTVNVGAGLGITVNADDVAVDTSSAHFTNGVKSKLNTDGVISSSTQFTSLTAPFTGSFTGSFRGTLTGTGSWASSASVAISSSFATSASWAPTAASTVGPGTVNSIALFNASSTVSSSNIFQSTGNIGIGTTSPDANLTVQGQASFNSGTLANPGIAARGDLNTGIYFPTTDTIGFVEGGVEAMRIDSSGNVGIGTTNPGTKLQIGNGNTDSNLLRLSVNYDTSRTTRAGIDWHDTSNTTGRISTEYDGTMVSIQFGSLYNSGYNSTTRMTIRGNGNVGIGTITPANTLQIQGNVSASSYTSSINNAVGFLGTASWAVSASRASSSNGVDVLSGGSTSALGTYSGSFSGSFFGNTLSGGTTNYIPLWTGTSAQSSSIIYQSSNNIGVGTLSPSVKFEVSGSQRITSGSLGVNVAPNATVGRIDASNDIVAYSSDNRLKTNIQPISEPLNKIQNLSGFTYTWNNLAQRIAGFNTESKLVGVYAQEVHSILPEAVKLAPFDNDGTDRSISGENYLTVQYEKLVPLLIEAIKELKAEVDELKRKI